MDKVPIIEVKSLNKQYRDSEFFSVKDLNLTIYKGEIFGLLGPNGAGKTTLISILCGLMKASSGDFHIDHITYKHNSSAIRQLIGVVPQEYALYPTLTAYENLEYFGAMLGLKRKTLKDSIMDGLDRMGLLAFAHKKTSSFSGGMKRRVNLLAGVLHRPKVLFLDEPTVGVDVQSKNAILDYLKELNAQGTTIVYTSHHLVEAESFCHRLAIMESGCIIAEGTAMSLVEEVPEARNLEDVFIALTGRGVRDVV